MEQKDTQSKGKGPYYPQQQYQQYMYNPMMENYQYHQSYNMSNDFRNLKIQPQNQSQHYSQQQYPMYQPQYMPNQGYPMYMQSPMMKIQSKSHELIIMKMMKKLKKIFLIWLKLIKLNSKILKIAVMSF